MRPQAVLIHGIVTWMQCTIISWRLDIEDKMRERREAEAIADPKKAEVMQGAIMAKYSSFALFIPSPHPPHTLLATSSH